MAPASGRLRRPFKTDFVRLEAARRDLGLAGERAVVERERRFLRQHGQDRLADRVEHLSETKGDGLGFDVLSFGLDGREKYIEVKTTRKAREFPFLVTRNEVAFSSEQPEGFHLYRVFDFGKPRTGLYTLSGPLDRTCVLRPDVYVARPAG